jgi:hypothetical protein
MKWRVTLGGAVPAVIAFFSLFGFVRVVGIIVCEHKVSAGYSLAEDYLRAVRDTAHPDSSLVSRSLVSIDPSKPIMVVSWMRQDKVQYFKGTTTASGRDTWVTIVPNLKLFCQDYVRSHGADPEHLALRLKQRLGMPPDSGNDTFVELTLGPKDMLKIFRPCGDPSINSNTCNLAIDDSNPPPTPDKTEESLKTVDTKNPRDVEKYWFLSKYYWSFASPNPYPWTSLGYTFDWARREDGSGDFVRWGESEFVIPGGTPIHFVSSKSNAEYCAPQ